MQKTFSALLAAAMLCISTTSPAKVSSDPSGQLQAALNNYLANEGKQEGVTGIAATVSYASKNVPVKKSFVAGVRGFPPYNRQPVTRDNLFEIGSITKSFAAVLILQLEAEGRLTLEDKIGKWFPEYPNWKNVTVRQLLNMTSGIPSYSKNPEFQKVIYGDIRKDFTDRQLLQYADPGKPIKHGENLFDYSNSNYTLAGMIVEKVTGHPFAEELQKRLLDAPVKLRNTYYVAGSGWKAVRAKIMPRMVHGYYYDDDSKKMVDTTDSNLSWAGPAGGMVSTTQDIADWVQVLYHGMSIPADYRQKALEQLESVVSMQTGKPIATVTKDDPKGFGLGVGYFYNDRDGRFWVYEGSGMGYRMMYLWRPCNNVTVIAALNSKGGEGGASQQGDHIQQLIVDMYDKIIAASPELACRN